MSCRIWGKKKRGQVELPLFHYPCDGLARAVMAGMGLEER
jgi:hypothetical protein